MGRHKLVPLVRLELTTFPLAAGSSILTELQGQRQAKASGSGFATGFCWLFPFMALEVFYIKIDVVAMRHLILLLM